MTEEKPPINGHKFTKRVKKKYLDLLAQGENKKDAAAKCGITRMTAYKHTLRDPEFAIAESDAWHNGQVLKMEEKNEEVADALHDAATSGNVTAIIWWEKTRANKKEIQVHEHTGADGGPIRSKDESSTAIEEMTEEQLDALIKSDPELKDLIEGVCSNPQTPGGQPDTSGTNKKPG